MRRLGRGAASAGAHARAPTANSCAHVQARPAAARVGACGRERVQARTAGGVPRRTWCKRLAWLSHARSDRDSTLQISPRKGPHAAAVSGSLRDRHSMMPPPARAQLQGGGAAAAGGRRRAVVARRARTRRRAQGLRAGRRATHGECSSTHAASARAASRQAGAGADAPLMAAGAGGSRSSEKSAGASSNRHGKTARRKQRPGRLLERGLRARN
jgi:hypothetical protein